MIVVPTALRVSLLDKNYLSCLCPNTSNYQLPITLLGCPSRAHALSLDLLNDLFQGELYERKYDGRAGQAAKQPAEGSATTL